MMLDRRFSLSTLTVLILGVVLSTACGDQAGQDGQGGSDAATSTDAGEAASDVSDDASDDDTSEPPACSDDFVEVDDDQCVRWREGARSRGRWAHGTVMLDDGRVLITGGLYRDHENVGTPFDLDSTQIYDPAEDTWSDAAPLPQERYAHTASTLPDGRVLVAGGRMTSEERPSALIYDPSADSWSTAPEMNEPRSYHRATTLADGRVFVYGGWRTEEANSRATTIEVFEPETEEWTSASDLGRPQLAVPLSDGRALAIFGGRFDEGNTIAVYDPDSDAWEERASTNHLRSAASATVLPNDDVLIVGDTTGEATALSTAELYRKAEDAWTTIDLPYKWYQGSATPLEHNHVLLASYHSDFPADNAGAPLLIDTEREAVTELPGEPKIAREHHAVRLESDVESVLFVGGVSSGGVERGGIPDVTVFERSQ